ncbi:hypothetical protein A4S05_23395 [Nostoc sp. KVJ20]|nr:hypothetical protein A4S05_23395 [Nostoc sp. KVJ20]
MKAGGRGQEAGGRGQEAGGRKKILISVGCLFGHEWALSNRVLNVVQITKFCSWVGNQKCDASIVRFMSLINK